MATVPSTSRQAFLANLRESGLVGDEQFAALEARLPETERGRLVARALVKDGVLTKFQAEQLLAGRTSGFVLGQYRVLDEIGKGGMGRVFKAVHVTMNRTVALKVLAPQLVETEKAQVLFQREMRAAARLMHPHIVTAYDANQIGNRYYLVLEYVDGPSLDRLVREQGPLPAGLACEFIRQAAEGLQYAHEMGMVHRDIKPSNLLVLLPGGEPRRRRCTVKILDFGLARLQGSENDAQEVATIVTRPNMVMGTPDFVAPEQARNLHAVDIRADLYSLGCTLYFLLTGEVPFPDGGTLEKLIRHTTEEPVPIDKLRGDVPPAVIALVRKLMAKDPALRYQTPAELATALESYAAEVDGWTAPAMASGFTSEFPQEEPAEGAPSSAEALVTPLPASEPNFVFHASPTEDTGALINTILPDGTATLVSGAHLPGAVKNPAAQADRRRITLAIAIAVAIVGLLVGLISLL